MAESLSLMFDRVLNAPLQGWTNFFLSAQLFGYAILFVPPIGQTKNGWSKPKCTSDRDKTRNIAFCSLSPKQDLQPSF